MRRNRVVFVATAWGPSEGGVNSLNLDITCALAKRTSAAVVCAVTKASPGDVVDAARNRVQLIEVGAPVNDSSDVILESVLRTLKSRGVDSADWVFGHDVITGPLAAKASKILGAKLGVFHHMNYGAYKLLQHPPDSVLERSGAQAALLEKADLIVAVGPKLRKSAATLAPTKTGQILQLVPGLAAIEPLRSPPELFSGVTFGRLERDADKVKQSALAIAGFARAASRHATTVGTDPRLLVIGCPPEERERLYTIVREHAGRYLAILDIPYQTSRDELFEQLRRCSIAMILSVHEGFGLAAWEAIAAGVPLILSKNSGAYELLESYGPGYADLVIPIDVKSLLGTDALNAADVDAVSTAIQHAAEARAIKKENALALREKLLRRGVTWHTAAALVRDACRLPSHEELAHFDLVIGTHAHGLDEKNSVIGIVVLLLEDFDEFVKGLEAALGRARADPYLAADARAAMERLELSELPAVRIAALRIAIESQFFAYLAVEKCATDDLPVRQAMLARILAHDRAITKRLEIRRIFVGDEETRRGLEESETLLQRKIIVKNTKRNVAIALSSLLAQLLVEITTNHSRSTGMDEKVVLWSKARYLDDRIAHKRYTKTSPPPWIST